MEHVLQLLSHLFLGTFGKWANMCGPLITVDGVPPPAALNGPLDFIYEPHMTIINLF